MSRQRDEKGSRESVQTVIRLKAENKKLERQNARLKKRLERYESDPTDAGDTNDDVFEALLAMPVAERLFKLRAYGLLDENERKDQCPDCSGTDIASLQTPNGVIVCMCKICRKKWSRA